MEEVDIEEDYSRAGELPQLHTRTVDIKEDSRAVELLQLTVDIKEDSRVEELPQLHVEKKWRTCRQSIGWRKRKRINPVRVVQNRFSQEKARNKFTDILDDLTRVLNITEITLRLGDAYDGNKILVSKYDVLNLASTYIQYLEHLLKENGVDNNFNRKKALQNIQFLTKLHKDELPSMSSA